MTFIGASSLLLTSAATAAVVVDFNNSNTGAFVGAAGIDTDSAGLDVWNFDDSNALFDGTVAGSNTKIYGGMRMSWGGGGAYSSILRLLGNPNIALSVQLNPTNITGLNTVNGMLIWKKEDFLNNGSTQAVQFGSGNTLSINFNSFNTTSAPLTTADIRFVVKQGGSYYVSTTNKTDLTTGVFSINPTSSTWASINTSTYAIGSIGAITFNNIEAVGIYYNMSRTGGQLLAQFNDFQADLSVIPEPSTFAALAGLAALGLTATRRRRT